MNIDARDAKVLRYFKKHGNLFLEDIPFESADLSELLKDGLIKTKDVSVPQDEGMFPLTSTAYFITQRGLAALKIRQNTAFISSTSLILTLIAAITGVIQLFR